MRGLILSSAIQDKQRFSKISYTPPFEVHLDVGDINNSDDFTPFGFSLFDYDAAVVHIPRPRAHTIWYYKNAEKLVRDSRIALDNGRTIICLPASDNFLTRSLNAIGPPVYDWITKFGVEFQDNTGQDIIASGAGRAEVIQNYLKLLSISESGTDRDPRRSLL